MLDLTLYEIEIVLGATMLVEGDRKSFSKVSTDTRNINDGDIFFALKGDNFDGNNYALDALKKGAYVCIIDRLTFEPEDVPSGASVLLVHDTQWALAALAKHYRIKMGVKVVGITGSVGKTSTKDIVAAALGEKYSVLKTEGNYNNHIGLPLTIFNIDKTHDVAVLEMGMNHSGEIEYLADIALPDVAVITNIGLSHIENLGSKENILKAKMEITSFFNKKSTLVVNGDDEYLNEIANEELPYNVVTIGTKTECDYSAKAVMLKNSSSLFVMQSKEKIINCSLNMPGKHNILNFLLATAVARCFDVSFKDIIKGLDNIKKTSMRLDITKVKGYTLVNDAYNASPDSMIAAIDSIVNMNAQKRILVLGTMRELGEFSNEIHFKIGCYAKEKLVDCIYTTGAFTDKYCEGFGEKCFRYENKSEMIQALQKNISNGDVVLIKASRGERFEDVYNSLT